MSLVYEPERRHFCGPNKYGYWDEHWHDPEGTVRECECGETWVSYRRPQPDGGHYYMGVYWRREGWWARRRRIKRQERSA